MIFLLIVQVLLLSSSSIAQAHVLGIDFGSEYIKVSGPHGDGGIDIVLNEISQRKTDDFIGFRFGERYIGSNARSLAARFPVLTASSINRLLSAFESENEKMISSFSYEYFFETNDEGRVSVPIPDPRGPFLAEELYSMLLSYSSKIAVNDGVPDPKMIVVTIPSGSSLESRALVNYAAKLSGLKVLGLLESTTAAAYYYGMRHRGFGNNTVTFALIDIGSSHSEVGVFQITPPEEGASRGNGLGTIRKLAVDSDFSFGGRALDLCIASIIEEEAKKTLNITSLIGGKTKEQLKSQFSLLRAAKAIRETLSVNTDTPYTVEGIITDRDFSSIFSRDVFEKKCGGEFQKVEKLFTKVVTQAGISTSQLSAVELLGGVSRTPKLIKDLKKMLSKDVGRTLNMDEAASFGAAYYAAKLSPFYTAKSFALRETFPTSISFSISPSLKFKSEKRPLVTSESLLGEVVSITVKRSSDFTISFFDNDDSREVAQLSVTNVSQVLESVTAYNPLISEANNTHIIRLQIALTDAALLEPTDVAASIRYSVNISMKETRNVTDDSGNASAVEETVSSPRVRTKVIPLSFSFKWMKPRSLPDQFSMSREKLRLIDEEESEKHQKAHSKNSLEAYIFWAKGGGVMENATIKKLLSEADIQQISEELHRTQEWLEEGQGSEDSCKRVQFDEKLKALKELVSILSSKKKEVVSENASSVVTEDL